MPTTLLPFSPRLVIAHRSHPALLCLALALSASACGKGMVGEAVRPDETTGAQALGDAPATFDCSAVAPAADPLVVDWPDQDRMDLGIALGGDGVAVVHYSCGGLRLLRHCKIADRYDFAGRSVMTSVVELESADKIAASLPVQGIALSAEVGGESKIEIATAIIGRMTTPVASPTKDMLEGECDEATHYIRAAYVGAFAMATATKGEAHAAADIMKASASGDSESGRKALTRDGDLGACETFDGTQMRPPGACQSAVRVELSPLAEGDAASAAPPKDPDKEPIANTCPSGYVSSGGGCTKKAEAEAYRCDPSDVEECKTQCERGDPTSCYNAALRLDPPIAPNDPTYPASRKKRVPLLEKACDGGVGPACRALGSHYNNKSAKALDPKKSAQYYDKACFQLFDGSACSSLAEAYLDGTLFPKDVAKGVAHKERACRMGNTYSCVQIAEWQLRGDKRTKTAKDVDKGLETLDRACTKARYSYACFYLEELLTKGTMGGKAKGKISGIKPNPPRAAGYHAKGCALNPKAFECK